MVRMAVHKRLLQLFEFPRPDDGKIAARQAQVLLGVLNMKQFLLADASLSYLGPE